MIKKRVFIIHQWDGNPDEGWLSWLSDELKKKGFEVIAPQMPNTGEPKIGEWVSFLADLAGEPDERTFFVGHSIGCQAIMRYLEAIYPQKVGGAVFVAGWFHLENLEGPEEEAIAKPWIETPINFEKVRNAANNFTVILSDADPYVPLGDKEIFEEKLGAKVIMQKDEGHFTEDDNVTEIPEILKLIK